MAITTEDHRNISLHFKGYWRSTDSLEVWDQAFASYRAQFPATTMSYFEFQQLADMRGIAPVAVGGGGDRPHDIRLSIGSTG